MTPVLAGNVVTVRGRSSAWYRLAPVRWGWQSEQDRDARLLAAAQVLASLVGRRLHFRGTTEPAARGFSEKATFVGVDIGRRRKVEDVPALVARPGFDGRPLDILELEWLMRRSVQLGHPSPTVTSVDAGWDVDDLAEITDSAQWDVPEAYGRSVRVTVDGVTRFVVVSVIGRMSVLSSADPWLALTDRLPFPVELSATVDVLPAAAVQRGVRSMILRAQSQHDHYREHNLHPPQALQAGIDTALEVQAELDSGFGTDLSTRVDGWYRIAVAGDSEVEALARAVEVADLYAPQITVVRPPGQYHLAREFVPGGQLASSAYRRRMPVTTAAGGMPQVTAQVGHAAGFYLGWTSGTGGRHIVLWDPWHSMEQANSSGLTLLLGLLGSGKSWLQGMVGYLAAMAGARCVLFDGSPAGALSALCDLPEFAGRSEHIDLTNATPGQGNPWQIVPRPRRDDFSDDDTYDHAIKLAASQMRALAVDSLSLMLPEAPTREERTALYKAARLAGAEPFPSARLMVDALDGIDLGLAELIREDIAVLPGAQFLFDTGTRIDYMHGSAGDPDSIVMKVITLRGLQLPDPGRSRREEWTTEERLSVMRLTICAQMAQRDMYEGDRHRRKLIGFDEAQGLVPTSAGQTILRTSSHDSRKFNTRVLMAAHGATDLAAADLGHLVDCMFIGQTEHPAAQADALELARIPRGCGYEGALATLADKRPGGRRDFVFNCEGTERITVDQDAIPEHIQRALTTTPGVRLAPVHTNGKVTV